MKTRRYFVWMLVGCWTTVVTANSSWAPATVEMPVKQVGPHCWYVEGALAESSTANQGFMSNAGFVITADSVIVFDALGTPALASKLIDVIHRLTPLPIKRVIISHYHADHFYGVVALRDAGAEVWAHRAAHEYLVSDVAQQRLSERRASLGQWLGQDFKLQEPDRWLDDDTRFTQGGLNFRIRHVGPGHSPEDLAMLVEPDGVLYGGDVVFAGRLPFVGEANAGRWLRAIERVLDMPIHVLVPGHGPASRNPRADLQLTYDYLTYLRQQMQRAVAAFISFDDAYAATDWRRFANLPAFTAANRSNAYNVYLQMEQETLNP